VAGPILLLSLAAFLAAAATRSTDALLPEIALEFGVGVAAAAITVTAFTFAYGLGQLIYGPLGARLGTFRTATLGCGLAAVGTLACALAPGLEALGLARALSGATAAAIIPMSMAYIGETVPYALRQTAIARFLLGQIGGLVFGLAFAGLLAELLSWRQLFLVLALGFLLIALLLARALAGGAVAAARPGMRASPLRQYRAVLAVHHARIVLAVVLLEGALCFGAFPYLSAHLDRAFGLSALRIGLVMALLGVGGALYVALVQTLLRRLGGERGLALWGGAALALGFWGLALARSWPALPPAIVLIGLGFYMLHNTLQTHATQMAPFDRSAAIALFAFCLFVGQALGAALLGPLGAAIGYPAVFAAAGSGLLGLALLFRRAIGRPAAQ
jgi:YNFM family putative membrane transporter